MIIALGLYVGTTIASYFLYSKTNANIKERLNRDGYIVLEENKSKMEKIEDGILLLTPFLNIIMANIFFFNRSTYDIVAKNNLEKGCIRRKRPEELANEQELAKLKNNENSPKTDSNITNIKSNSEMNNEEKKVFLEREKTILLSVNSSEMTKPYNDHGAYQK